MNFLRSEPQAGGGLSTRTYLVLLVGALLVPALAFTAVLANRYVAAERSRFEQEAAAAARRIAAQIDRELAGLQATLQTLSTSSRLRLGEYDAFHRQASDVRSFIGEHVVLRDASGQQLASTRLPFGSPLPRTAFDFDRQVIETKAPVISGVFTGAVASAPVFAIVVPVLHGGEVTQFLSLSVSTDRLVPLLREGLKPEWAAGVIDRNGVFLARSDRHREVSGRPGPPDFVAHASGAEGLWRGTGAAGVPVLAGYARSTLTGWRVGAGVPDAVIEAPLMRALWLLTAVGAALVGTSLLLAYGVATRIAGSVASLAACAARLGHGETVLPVRGALREANEVMQGLSAASIGLRERARERDAAEAATRASEAQFRQLAEALPQLVWIMGADGAAIYVNKRFAEYLGHCAGLDVGDAAIHPDDRAQARKVQDVALSAGRPYDTIVRLRRHDGVCRWHLLAIVPLKRDGEIAAWIGAATDIDDLRRAEDANSRLAAIVTASADAIMSFSAQGVIQSWNPAAEALFGYSAEEAIGAPAGLLVPADSPKGPRGVFDRALAGEIVKTDTVRVTKSGELIDVAITAAPMRTSGGAIVGVSTVLRDIRRRKRREAALRESERRLQALLDNASVAIFLLDERRHCVYMNVAAEKLTGFALDETQGQALHEVIHARPQDRAHALEESPIEGALRASRQERGEAIFVHKAGHLYPVAFTASPIRDDDAKVVGTIIEVRDISAEKAAQQHQQLLINELNHRVKNTLATVQSIAVQTLRSSGSDREARAAFEARLLALSKVHNILTRENWEGASLSDIVAEVLAPHESDHRALFHIDGPDVRLHPRMALPLAMALHELATNATKYGALSNDSGVVSIAWGIKPASGEQRLWLRWAEAGGPPVAPPGRKGFGSRLIERSLVVELGGEATIDYAVGGVVCRVEAPLSPPAPMPDLDGDAAAGARSAAA
ncbi:MAG TPA: PAS domain S-box protein [Beijerinckiaceae bacterium]